MIVVPMLNVCSQRISAVFSVADAILLRRRIAAEERALSTAGDYDEHFPERSRPWPGRSR